MITETKTITAADVIAFLAGVARELGVATGDTYPSATCSVHVRPDGTNSIYFSVHADGLCEMGADIAAAKEMLLASFLTSNRSERASKKREEAARLLAEANRLDPTPATVGVVLRAS
jgi:hypothetical protein